ncbi:hypothetical protein HYW55_04775 [Candidatus Gottesmanbacteria bacterium]|nr:hypothetical protein [Candidatus Gottesmanbacteria bacterium]
MEIDQSKRFLIGFIFGSIFALFFILFFGSKNGRSLLEKLLDDEEAFEKSLRGKLLEFRNFGNRRILPSDHIQSPLNDLSKNDSAFMKNLSADFPQSKEEKRLSFTKSMKHFFKKNGKILTS